MKNKLGFTLIEMLVVVLIIGILAGIALPQYQKSVEKARAAEALISINAILKSIDILYLKSGEYPNMSLIGCSDSEDGKCGVLDIDVDSSLICDVDNGNFCRSNYFIWQAFCYGSGCDIFAFRTNNTKDISTTAGNIWNFSEYTLEISTGNGTVSYKDCYYKESSSYAKSVCQDLESQGWGIGII